MKLRGMHWMLAAVMVAGVGCNREEPVAEQTQTAPQPAERQDDAWITTSLQGHFYADDAVRGRNVNVTTQNGVVTLQGTVDSESARERAVAIAREVDGVVDVQDQLRVDTAAATTGTTDRPDTAQRDEQPTGTTGDVDTTPGWITTKIQAQYFVNPEIKPWNIDVTTANNGVVTLEGEVEETADKTEAVRIARETEGVTRVEDRLRVRGEAERETADPAVTLERPDVWLTAKVQSKYFLDDEVKGLDIDVDTNEGVVTLSGTVRNESERRQALALARNTEGVREVVDKLQLTPAEADAAREPAETDRRRMDPVRDLSRPDEWITMKIQSKYFLDADVKGRQINVDTVEGVVTLKGAVTTDAEKTLAETIAKDTEGVSRVVNQLTVGGGEMR